MWLEDERIAYVVTARRPSEMPSAKELGQAGFAVDLVLDGIGVVIGRCCARQAAAVGLLGSVAAIEPLVDVGINLGVGVDEPSRPDARH